MGQGRLGPYLTRTGSTFEQMYALLPEEAPLDELEDNARLEEFRGRRYLHLPTSASPMRNSTPMPPPLKDTPGKVNGRRISTKPRRL